VSKFSEQELAYLARGRLGRLATIDAEGPHVVPLGWNYNAELDTIDIGGRDLAHTRKFRNVRHNQMSPWSSTTWCRRGNPAA
jgi:pyridoxamine 5'-phosphate oxidase family protein